MAQKSFWILQNNQNKNKEGAFLLKKTIKKSWFYYNWFNYIQKGFYQKNNLASNSVNSNIFKNFDYILGRKLKNCVTIIKNELSSMSLKQLKKCETLLPKIYETLLIKFKLKVDLNIKWIWTIWLSKEL